MTELARALQESPTTSTTAATTTLTDVFSTPPQSQQPPPSVSQVLLDIGEFKESAIMWARKALQDDINSSMPILEIKEVKDLTQIVTQIENSYKSQEQDSGTTTVNILVQNLVNKYDDDC